MAIHHEAVITATPQQVYEVLTTSAKFTKATGDRPATIGAGEGATFELFGGPIYGRHIELVPGERVVQAWRVKPWEPGVYSIVRFTLKAEGNGTRMVIDHDGYPAAQHDHLSSGWLANYVEPFTAYFKS
jgi:activator of HSP90 ATPase